LGESAEKQYRAADRPQHHEAPQFSVAPAQQEPEKYGSYRQAIGAVQRRPQPGQPQPKGPQQVIQRPGGQSQQDGLPEQQQL
jgi:hypothetical protein